MGALNRGRIQPPTANRTQVLVGTIGKSGSQAHKPIVAPISASVVTSRLTEWTTGEGRRNSKETSVRARLGWLSHFEGR
jgi:hypothetical protein